jgi:hypothetical protein
MKQEVILNGEGTASKPSEKFDGLLRQVLSVPKKEIDRREAEYRKQRARRKK